MSSAEDVQGHQQFTNESGTWCYSHCPRPEEECGQLAIAQNDPHPEASA